MDTALTTQPEGKYAALAVPAEEMISTLRDNLGSDGLDRFKLQRVKVPTGGQTIWTIPSVRGDQGSPTLTGVIVGWGDKRAFWAGEYKPSEILPPDCSSEDGVEGLGNPGGPCDLCPLSKFGSHKNGFGQACKQTRVVLMIREKGMLPLALFAPPTSITKLKQFFLDLTSEGLPYHSIEVELTLSPRRVKSGYDVAEIQPRMVEELDPVARHRAKAYADFMTAKLLSGVSAREANS